jgi:hypothetical protein
MHRLHALQSILNPSPLKVIAFSGQTGSHARHPIQLFGQRISWIAESISSGLWHHLHWSGQPFRKTVVRIPGPSSVENFWIPPTMPVML